LGISSLDPKNYKTAIPANPEDMIKKNMEEKLKITGQEVLVLMSTYLFEPSLLPMQSLDYFFFNDNMFPLFFDFIPSVLLQFYIIFLIVFILLKTFALQYLAIIAYAVIFYYLCFYCIYQICAGEMFEKPRIGATRGGLTGIGVFLLLCIIFIGITVVVGYVSITIAQFLIIFWLFFFSIFGILVYNLKSLGEIFNSVKNINTFIEKEYLILLDPEFHRTTNVYKYTGMRLLEPFYRNIIATILFFCVLYDMIIRLFVVPFSIFIVWLLFAFLYAFVLFFLLSYLVVNLFTTVTKPIIEVVEKLEETRPQVNDKLEGLRDSISNWIQLYVAPFLVNLYGRRSEA
jgi:hypothetical protein